MGLYAFINGWECSHRAGVGGVGVRGGEGGRVMILDVTLIYVFVLMFSLFRGSTAGSDTGPPLAGILASDVSRVISTYPNRVNITIVIGGESAIGIGGGDICPVVDIFGIRRTLTLYGSFSGGKVSLSALMGVGESGLSPGA